MVQDRTKITMTDRKSRTRCQNEWPWKTLNCRNVTLAEIKKFMEPTRKIWTKIDSCCQRQNVGLWF